MATEPVSLAAEAGRTAAGMQSMRLVVNLDKSGIRGSDSPPRATVARGSILPLLLFVLFLLVNYLLNHFFGRSILFWRSICFWVFPISPFGAE